MTLGTVPDWALDQVTYLRGRVHPLDCDYCMAAPRYGPCALHLDFYLETPVIEQAHQEWLAEAVERFGDDPLNWRFRCPNCGHETTLAEFKAAGGDPGRAPVECIGRAALAKGEEVTVGCDWAAYGLLGTNGRGRLIRRDNGSEHECFDFADPVAAATP